MRCPDATIKGRWYVSLCHQSLDIPSHPEGNNRWVQKPFSSRTVYNSKENARRAPDQIRHPGRQMKHPRKLFSINPRCVNCEQLHARFHTRPWGRGLLLHGHTRTKPSRICWRHLSCPPTSSWAIPSPYSLFLIPSWTHLTIHLPPPRPCALISRTLQAPAIAPSTLRDPRVPHTTDHTHSLSCSPGAGRDTEFKHQPAKNQVWKHKSSVWTCLKPSREAGSWIRKALERWKNQSCRSKGAVSPEALTSPLLQVLMISGHL